MPTRSSCLPSTLPEGGDVGTVLDLEAVPEDSAQVDGQPRRPREYEEDQGHQGEDGALLSSDGTHLGSKPPSEPATPDAASLLVGRRPGCGLVRISGPRRWVRCRYPVSAPTISVDRLLSVVNLASLPILGIVTPGEGVATAG